MKDQSRTEQQNKAYFLFLDHIALEMKNQNVSLAELVVEIQPEPTRVFLHDIFKAILEKMWNKKSTKDMTREELNSCLDVLMDALAKNGVNLPFPDSSKNNLLQFYN